MVFQNGIKLILLFGRTMLYIELPFDLIQYLKKLQCPIYEKLASGLTACFRNFFRLSQRCHTQIIAAIVFVSGSGFFRLCELLAIHRLSSVSINLILWLFRMQRSHNHKSNAAKILQPVSIPLIFTTYFAAYSSTFFRVHFRLGCFCLN